MKEYEFDLSRFTNLKTITLRGDLVDKFQTDGFIYLLSTLRAPELQGITLVLPYDSEFKYPKLIDDFIDERFQDLWEVCVEYLLYDWAEEDMTREGMIEMFPKMDRRGILTVRHHAEPFRYHIIPKDYEPR